MGETRHPGGSPPRRIRPMADRGPERKFMFKAWIPAFAGMTMLFVAVCFAKRSDIPTVEATETGRVLAIPQELDKFLSKEFPKYRLPSDQDFNPEMLTYFFSNLIGLHPAVAWGDFNQDKKRDYALLIITGDTPWGPLVELVVLNGTGKKSHYETFRLGEVYSPKDDYISFANEKLQKGKFRKGAWYINWDKKSASYVVHKS